MNEVGNCFSPSSCTVSQVCVVQKILLKIYIEGSGFDVGYPCYWMYELLTRQMQIDANSTRAL